MRINPCHGCPAREGCPDRDALRARAKGLGAVSVTFRCARLASLLRPGVRITVDIPTIVEGFYDDEVSMRRVKVPATVTATRPDHRFSCVIDPGHVTDDNVAEGKDSEVLRFRRMARHTRVLAFLDEPAFPVCEGGNVQRTDTGCDARGGACFCRDIVGLERFL